MALEPEGANMRRLSNFGQTFLFGNFLQLQRNSSDAPVSAPRLVNQSASVRRCTTQHHSRADGDAGQGIHSTTSNSRRTNPVPAPRITRTIDNTQCEKPDKMGEAAGSDTLVKRNLELLESGNFADAEIICNGRVWKVHKVILRSGCIWFDKAFANNWKEAQTGRIHVEEQQPEQINELLKFIYSGRFVPELAAGVQFISKPRLEINVSLWQTADFFKLPGLKTEVYNHLFDRITFMLRFFSARKLDSSKPLTEDEVKRELNTFFADFSRAVKKAYKCPPARDIQKLFAIFVCALRKHVPESISWDLMKIPGFKKDMSAILFGLHFMQPTEQFVEDTLPTPRVTTQNQCSKCCCQIWIGQFSQNELWDMALDPFTAGFLKWCRTCSYPWVKSLLKTMIEKCLAESDRL